MRGLFISATGTGVGKTFVTRGLAAAMHASGRRVAALKPMETGVSDLDRSDAALLARACGRPELADYPGFYRAKLGVAPYAAQLEGEPAPPPVRALVDAVHHAARGSEFALVEGAGGLLVPIDRRQTMADLVAALGLPLVLVAPNALGVLSHVLTAAESARSRGIELRALVLVDPAQPGDELSMRTNAKILDERLGTPVFEFPHVQDADEALAQAANTSSLVDLLLDSR
ncbi:MAG: dethiobiotin synthase [Myxococcales bacterium]